MIICFLLLLFSRGEIRIGVQIFTNSRAGFPNVRDLFRNVFRPSMFVLILYMFYCFRCQISLKVIYQSVKEL